LTDNQWYVSRYETILIFLRCTFVSISKRSQREKDADKQKEEEHLQQQNLQREAERMAAEAAAKEAQAYVVPPDPQLLRYIDEVTESIKALPSTLEQAIALARYKTYIATDQQEITIIRNLFYTVVGG
jgi:hypothetical protein